jgi:hypothetical protein
MKRASGMLVVLTRRLEKAQKKESFFYYAIA